MRLIYADGKKSITQTACTVDRVEADTKMLLRCYFDVIQTAAVEIGRNEKKRQKSILHLFSPIRASRQSARKVDTDEDKASKVKSTVKSAFSSSSPSLMRETNKIIPEEKAGRKLVTEKRFRLRTNSRLY